VIGGGHDGEHAVGQAHPGPRPVLDLAAREPLEAGLDRRQGIGGREELLDFGFSQVERQARSLFRLRPVADDVVGVMNAVATSGSFDVSGFLSGSSAPG
jgi:hypothetical protein